LIHRMDHASVRGHRWERNATPKKSLFAYEANTLPNAGRGVIVGVFSIRPIGVKRFHVLLS